MNSISSVIICLNKKIPDVNVVGFTDIKNGHLQQQLTVAISSNTNLSPIDTKFLLSTCKRYGFSLDSSWLLSSTEEINTYRFSKKIYLTADRDAYVVFSILVLFTLFSILVLPIILQYISL